MLFRKSIEPRCTYCQRGASLGEGEVICPKKGIVSEGGHCRHFVYDPLKRQPNAPAVLDLSKLDEEDFSL
jgi:hypothetical protein